MADNIHKNHRSRVKETFMQAGADNMHDINLLEFMLFYAIPQKDTNPIAHALLDKFETFDRVLSASVEELMTVEGVGQNTAIYLTMFVPVFKRYSIRKGSNRFFYEDTESLTEYLISQYIGAEREKIMIMHFDTQLQFIGHSWITEGDVNQVEIDRKKIISEIINNCATNVIIVHNHPSGITAPSCADIDSAIQLADLLAPFGINLLDAIIVTDKTIKKLGNIIHKKRLERTN